MSLVLTLLTAKFSYAYFHEDEYHQVIAFALLKMGRFDPARLPWEYAKHVRPWMQPALYYVIGRVGSAVGVTDTFVHVFIWRIATGLVAWGALAVFVNASLSWFSRPTERWVHLRIATLLGFLPYLFVRTSSETLAMAALTFGFVALVGRYEPQKPEATSLARVALAGMCFGFAFELRYQTALLAVGLLAWFIFVARARAVAIAVFILASLPPLGLGAWVDHWGYGVWVFPAWSYVKVNLVDGVAARFGAELPFAYVYLLLTNVFAPIAAVLLISFVLTVWRHPRHPVTWTTLPFFFVHCLISHKEERFIFPMGIVATSFVVLGFGPGQGRPLGWATWVWERRGTLAVKVLAFWNLALAAVLAFYPLGWNHHVPLSRYLHYASIDDFHAFVLDSRQASGLAYGPGVVDVQLATAPAIVARLEAGEARPYLISNQPRLATGVDALDRNATLLYSEFPLWHNPGVTRAMLVFADAYNAHALPPLRRIEWWSLYRLDVPPVATSPGRPLGMAEPRAPPRSPAVAP